MTTRLRGSEPVNGAIVAGAGLSGVAVGNKLTYTVPVGMQGKLQAAAVGNFTLAPTVAINASIGGTVIALGSGAANFSVTQPVLLAAGDSIVVRVTTGVAASSFDAVICVEEYPVS
jgi:hypothetical protein